CSCLSTRIRPLCFSTLHPPPCSPLFPYTTLFRSLGHVAVGRAFGMRFTDWYIGSITRPQPGVKVDYATYIVTPARQRAWMHAAGAIVTKLVPFALVPLARAASLPRRSRAALWLLGLRQIATDGLWSVGASDWKQFRREMRHA